MVAKIQPYYIDRCVIDESNNGLSRDYSRSTPCVARGQNTLVKSTRLRKDIFPFTNWRNVSLVVGGRAWVSVASLPRFKYLTPFKREREPAVTRASDNFHPRVNSLGKIDRPRESSSHLISNLSDENQWENLIGTLGFAFVRLGNTNSLPI